MPRAARRGSGSSSKPASSGTSVLAYDWSRPDSVSWHLVRSKAMKSQDGNYRLTDSGGSTTVTYDLSVALKMRVLGVFKRKGQKVIIDAAMGGLKKRVESGS